MADKSVHLEWSGDALRFQGAATGGPTVTLDSDGTAGPSPMDALLMSVAGCMGIDVVMILQKGRVHLDSLSVDMEGDRAEKAPRRFTAIRMTYRITGPAPEDAAKVQRAVDLSRDRYCSVLHSLANDIDLEIRVEVA